MNQNIVKETSNNIRALARVSLQGKWKLAIGATVVYVLAIFLPQSILAIWGVLSEKTVGIVLSYIYSILVCGPFALGYTILILNIFRRKKSEISQVFCGFENFFKAFGLYFMTSLFIVLWILATVSPVLIIMAVTGIIQHENLCVIIIYLCMIPAGIAYYRYSQAFLIMSDHPEYGVMQCITASKMIMAGNKLKLFCLNISFIGWSILTIVPMIVLMVVFGVLAVMMGKTVIIGVSIGYIIGYIIAIIGMVFLIPYMYIANATFYELATGNLRPGVIEEEAKADVLVLEKSVVELNKTE